MSTGLWPLTGAINLQNRSWIVVDGGVPCGPNIPESSCQGIIENTNNGSRAPYTQNTNQTSGINVDGTSNVTIQNILIRNIYVHFQGDADSLGQPTPSGIGAFPASGVTGLTVHDSKLHDANWMISFVGEAGNISNLNFYNNEIYNVNHCWAVGIGNTTNSDSILIHDSTCHDTANWDEATNNQHHDGIHLYTVAGSSVISNAYAWNLQFYGDWGQRNTGHIFDECIGTGHVDITVYNSFFTDTGAGGWWLNNGAYNDGNINGCNLANSHVKLYNNTFMMPTTQSAYTIQSDVNFDIRNNVIVNPNSNPGTVIQETVPSGGTGTVNYNVYASSSSTPFQPSPGQSYATWKGRGFDANSPSGNIYANGAAVKVTSSGVPQPGFVGTGAGLNLCNGVVSCTGNLAALANDINGNPRPLSTAWDIGAFNASTAAVSCSPPSLSFGNQSTGSSSASQAVTCTNTSSSSVTVTSCSITGTNANQFSITDPSNCPSTLATNASETQHVQFSPTVAGLQSGNYSVTYNGASIASATLSGTGTSTAPVLTVTPSTTVACGSTNLNVQVNCPSWTLQNTGTATATISSIVIAGSGYAQSNTCGATLIASATCTITATFTPAVVGSATGTVTVTDTPDSLTATGTASGTGVDPSAISLVALSVCASQSYSSSTGGICTITSTGSGHLLGVLIISAFNFNPTISSITDNQSNLWQEAAGSRSTDTNTNSMGDIWYSAPAAAGTTALTIKPSSTGTMAVVVYEFSNVNALDAVGAASTQAAAASPSGASVTISQSKEAVISLMNPQTSVTGIHSGNNFTNDSLTFSAGWAHLLTSSTGAKQAQWDCSTACTNNSSTAAFYESAPSVNSPGGVSINGVITNGQISH